MEENIAEDSLNERDKEKNNADDSLNEQDKEEERKGEEHEDDEEDYAELKKECASLKEEKECLSEKIETLSQELESCKAECEEKDKMLAENKEKLQRLYLIKLICVKGLGQLKGVDNSADFEAVIAEIKDY